MTLADTAAVTPRLEKVPVALDLLSRPPGEFGTCRLVKDAGTLFGERRRVPLDDPGHPGRPTMVEAALGSLVETRNCRRQRAHHIETQASPCGKPIEQALLIETVHFDEPVHGRARATERQRSIRLTRDRHHAAIEIRCGAAVDLNLGVAHRLAPFDGREVEIVVSNGSFQLPGTRPGKKHDGCVGLDALDRCASVGRRRAQERDDFSLIFSDHRSTCTHPS